MASDKPLPDTDDDIIDLTDLVEEGGAGNGAADDGVDMSFEQELDDLFGDSEPLPAKAPPAAAAPADAAGEDDLFDLAGFEVDDAPKAAAASDGEDDLIDLAGFEAEDAAPKATAAAADDDAIDLSNFGLDDDADDPLAGLGDDKPAPPAATPAMSADEDDALDLVGLGLDDDAAPDAATPDLSDVSFEDLGPGDAAKAAAADSLDDIDFGDLDAAPAETAASAPDGDESMDLADLDFETATPEADVTGEPEAVAAVLADIDGDEAPKAVSDADIDALLAEPGDDEPLPDLLGTLPDVPEDDDTLAAFDAAPDKPAPRDSLPEADDLTDFADLPDVDELPAEAIPLAVAAAAAVGAAAMPAVVARAQAGPSVGGIDLGALDNLIDSSKAPAVEAETPAPDKALAGRIAALEAAAADLAGRLDALPPPPDENALAVALAGRLESALTLRVESLLAKYEPAPDASSLKDDILAEVRASLEDHRAALLAELPPPAAAPSGDLDAALERLRESLARLEALGQGRHTQFEDFARSMETSLAELRRELPDPEDFVTAKRLAEALDGLGETLAASLDGRFEATAEAARQEVQTLAASLDERLADLAETARQAAVAEIHNLDARFDALAETAVATARQEAYTLAQALEPRLAGLENERIDPVALAATLRQNLLADVAPASALDNLAAAVDAAAQDARDALNGLGGRVTPGDLDAALNTLRANLLAELETAVPKAAAAVIREEIAVLLQEFAG
ncbi:hypothetical protein [Solidesulfovibrio magneticus]|uniref:Uncharacterized protein n=1 Tax=Solidesulfovibrio magneticus (strain ATCC 700980 / DSM 13731 / RS-1) TaxID=573370 RepID=C4XGG8_SOLM1|nr:hypothetical protein [Solidesulfovibrio magneticus]BAH73748.1 hypothetical protein DMR_02570 [Solidesulfovibrio magneticus RS-1]